VQKTCTDFETAAGLTLQHHWSGIACDLGEAFFEFENQGTFSKRGQIHARCAPGQRHAPLDRLVDRIDQLGQSHRLFQKIDCAEPGGLDCSIDGAMSRHHDDRHGELATARPFLEQRHAVSIRHPDIEQHQVRASLRSKGTCRLGVFRQVHVIALIGEDFRQQFTNAHFVVHDENMPAHVLSPAAI